MKKFIVGVMAGVLLVYMYFEARGGKGSLKSSLGQRKLRPYRDLLDKDYKEMVVYTPNGEYEFRGSFVTIPEHLKEAIFKK